MGFASVINAIRVCGKLVIGRIHGKAVGGGVGLASACDYTFATQHAAVRLSELAVGIGPFVIGPAVERVGKCCFCQMAITPEVWQSAAWAQQKESIRKYLKPAKPWMRLSLPWPINFELPSGRAPRFEDRVLARNPKLGSVAGRARCHQW